MSLASFSAAESDSEMRKQKCWPFEAVFFLRWVVESQATIFAKEMGFIAADHAVEDPHGHADELIGWFILAAPLAIFTTWTPGAINVVLCFISKLCF